MRTIKGDLGLMDLFEILQWAEVGQKSGSLVIGLKDISKYFFFQNGKLIYFTSSLQTEQLGYFLQASHNLSRDQVASALQESKKHKRSFASHLVSEKILTAEKLNMVMSQIMQRAITDAMQWDGGSFTFKDTLPAAVLNETIKLNITKLLFLSSVEIDEKKESESSASDQILNELIGKIQDGAIDLPPTPSLLQKLNKASQDDSIPITEIGKMIMGDQILSSKVLKVVNSPFYNLRSKVTSLGHAISVIGLSSLKSIATTHILSEMSVGNEKKIRPILEHSLLTAFIAKRLAPLIQLKAEEVFVCGILHDIGKTVLIGFLENYELDEVQYEGILKNFHTKVGHVLAKEWGFAEVVQEAVLFHHEPEAATQYSQLVHLTHLANLIANEPDAPQFLPVVCNTFQLKELLVKMVLEQIEQLRDSAVSLV